MKLWWITGLLLLLGLPAVLLASPAATDTPRTLTYDGQERTYNLHLPPGYDGSQPYPLVVGLHGGGGSADQFQETSRMNQVADEYGFIAVYPNGTGRPLQTWNAGHCCGAPMRQDTDDTGFIRALVESLQTELNIDQNRIYAAGMSNGAMLSYWLAAAHADLFAAVAPVAGTIGGQVGARRPVILPPAPSEPVSIVAFNGMLDTSVKYEGGITEGVDSGRIDLSVAESIGFWVEYNSCDPMPVTDVSAEGRLIRDTYTCAGGTTVVLYTLTDGTHSWPGSTRTRPRADAPAEYIDATRTILEFFLAHPKSA